jgi:nitrogen fixation protein NifB
MRTRIDRQRPKENRERDTTGEDVKNVPECQVSPVYASVESHALSEPRLSFLRFHPCYSDTAHSRYGRIHLPVAPACNIHCRYCDRQVGDCYHSFRPGVTKRVMTAAEALAWTADALRAEPRLKVAGIAGPGEPLANEATFRTLEVVGHRFPRLLLCLSTNGLLLPQFAPRLASLGVQTITVTMNALRPDVGARIYEWVVDHEPSGPGTTPLGRCGSTLRRGLEAAALLARRQLDGIAVASAAGIAVKVNTVLIPGINETETGPIAQAAQEHGAVIQNVMPLIPLGSLSHFRPPTCHELQAARSSGSAFLPQFRRCRQCRADAVGVPGEEHGQLPTWGHGPSRL